jgi:hypothetical protein
MRISAGDRQFTKGMTAAAYVALAIGAGGFIAAVAVAIVRFAKLYGPLGHGPRIGACSSLWARRP